MLHSEVAQKVWDFVSTLMPHMGILSQFQTINIELDNYLTELAKIEFNLNPDELQIFAKNLADCNNEFEKSIIIKAKIRNSGITLPFEIGNHESTRKWLSSLAKK